jgi:hypothetical protein
MICTQINEDKEMDAELKDFLARHRACRNGLSRLAATGAATAEEEETNA